MVDQAQKHAMRPNRARSLFKAVLWSPALRWNGVVKNLMAGDFF